MMAIMKPFLRTVHLWAGLIFGTILVLQGLTGSLLSWRHELDAWLNPGLLQVAPPPGLGAGDAVRVTPAAVQAVTDRLAATPGYGKPDMLMFPQHAGDVFIAWYRPQAPASMWEVGVTRQVMVDPANLAILGERNWGEAGLSRPLLMPTMFHLHRYLMAGDAGKLVIAVQGVALLLLTLTGIVLWWPRLSASAFWNAITVRHGGNWPRFNFQLHRAAGFYAAPLFLVTSVSGVYFNMPAWVTPVVNAVAPVTPNGKFTNRSAAGAPGIGADEAVLAVQAQYPQARVSRLSFPAKAGQPFEVRVRQPGEWRQGDGATRVSIDSGNGAVLGAIDPLRDRGGNAFFSLMFPLHTGEAFGVVGRIVICIAGLLPLVFFVTGLVVYVKLRRKPAGKKQRAKPVAMTPAREPGAAGASPESAMPAGLSK
jgi:uncharacterized iron-regulated membrane protein